MNYMADDILTDGATEKGTIDFEPNRRPGEGGGGSISYFNEDSSWCLYGDALRRLADRIDISDITINGSVIDGSTYYTTYEISAMRIKNNDSLKFTFKNNGIVHHRDALVCAKDVEYTIPSVDDYGEISIRCDSSVTNQFLKNGTRITLTDFITSNGINGVDGVNIYLQKGTSESVPDDENLNYAASNLIIKEKVDSLFKNYDYLIEDTNNEIKNKLRNITLGDNENIYFWMNVTNYYIDGKKNHVNVGHLNKTGLESFKNGYDITIIKYLDLNPDVPVNPK